MRQFPVLLILLASIHGLCSADIIHVPGDQPTIQQGIDAAKAGDTVFVSPGAYRENVKIENKDIVLKSSEGADRTLIDGQHGKSTVTLESVGPGCVLQGFTIINGSGTPDFHDTFYGGGICCSGNVEIVNNPAPASWIRRFT